MKTIMVVISSLAAGLLAGYFVFESPRAENENIKTERSKKSSIARVDSDSNVKVLRERILELEERLKKRETEEVSKKPKDDEKPLKDFAKEILGSFRQRMEKMKVEDPERYQNMTNRFAQFRMQRANIAASRLDFLSSIDVSRMSDEAKRTHEELQGVIVEREALEEKMHNADLTDEERRDLFIQMRQIDNRMRKLNEKERDNLLQETAKGLGFDAKDAKEITGAIKEVIEATSSPFDFPRFRGRR